MRIGELARLCGVTASKIRFYEAHGLLPPAQRGSNGYRDYAQESVQAIALILQAHGLGFSLNEIRRAAPAGSLDTLDCDRIVDLLRRKRAEVRAQFGELARLSAAIDASIREFERRRKRSGRAVSTRSKANAANSK